ncbi:hypothetical protein H0H93_008934 [Arthromyces matolae]|nr:hypothetical protein H0H93_008934 [Arthromyces matolae]
MHSKSPGLSSSSLGPHEGDIEMTGVHQKQLPEHSHDISDDEEDQEDDSSQALLNDPSGWGDDEDPRSLFGQADGLWPQIQNIAIEHWRAMKEVHQLIMIVPAILNLKGNLEMNLSARLGTASNVGELDDPAVRRSVIIGNMSLLQVQAAVVSFIAACLAIFLGAVLPRNLLGEVPIPSNSTSIISDSVMQVAEGTILTPRRPITLPKDNYSTFSLEKLVMVASTGMAAASLSSIVLGSFMCTLIMSSSSLEEDIELTGFDHAQRKSTSRPRPQSLDLEVFNDKDDHEDGSHRPLLDQMEGYNTTGHRKLFWQSSLWPQIQNIVIEYVKPVIIHVVCALKAPQRKHWKAIKQVHQLMMVIPAILNLKGNLEMNLSARLGTTANVGGLDNPSVRRSIIIGNLSLLQVQAAVVSFISAFLALVLGIFLPSPMDALLTPPTNLVTEEANSSSRDLAKLIRRRPISLPKDNYSTFTFDKLIMVASTAMTAASLSSIALGSFMCALIIVCRKYGRDPDNIAPPVASCLGDLVTLLFMGAVSVMLINVMHTVIPLLIVLAIIAFAIFCLIKTLQNPDVRPLLSQGWVPLFAAMLISSATGIVLDIFVSRYEGFALLAILIGGLPGSAGSILISRLSTSLHVGAIVLKTPSPLSKREAPEPSSQLVIITLLVVTLPVYLIFLLILRGLNWLRLPIAFVALSVLFFFVTVVIALYAAKYLTNFLWSKNCDPDVYALPIHSALVDLVGHVFLAICYEIAQLFMNYLGEGPAGRSGVIRCQVTAMDDTKTCVCRAQFESVSTMNSTPICVSQPHPFRVIGHAGMRTTSDGSLIIKPAFPAELQFYQDLTKNPYIASLRPFIPKFLGSLQENSGMGDDAIPRPPGRTESLVLENLLNAFSKPNTLDVKLGTVFHDDTTDPAKVLRMEKTSRETTSWRTGVRLTEFQVYDNKTSKPVCTPKSFGKAIKETELAHGFAKCFPVHGEPSSSSSSSSTLGLPRRLLLPVLHGIRETTARIREAYASLEMRIIGGSLLIIYEADWTLAEEGLKRVPPQPLDNRKAPGVRRLPYNVKLVDFAHTQVMVGSGPDEGVLLGLDTMLKLLDGRIAELTDP